MLRVTPNFTVPAMLPWHGAFHDGVVGVPPKFTRDRVRDRARKRGRTSSPGTQGTWPHQPPLPRITGPRLERQTMSNQKQTS